MKNTTSLASPLTLFRELTTNGSLEFATLMNFIMKNPVIAVIITLCCMFQFRLILTLRKNERLRPGPQLPPGPKPWPVVGSLPEMMRNRPTFRWLHKIMSDLNTEIARIKVGSTHIITVTCPEISREFFRVQDALFVSRPISIATWVTTKGFLTTALTPYGEQWKKMRRVLATEILSPARHRWMFDRRLEEADHLVRYVFNQCKKGFVFKGINHYGGLVNVRVAAQHYAGNVIRKMVFGKRFFGEGNTEDGGPGLEEVEHVDALFTILATIYSFCVSDYFPSLVGIDLDGHEKIITTVVNIIGKYHDPIIKERIQQWRGDDVNGLNNNNNQVNDLLDVLITLRNANGRYLLSMEEIQAQITEIMIATVDNPSNAVEWAIGEMINKPEILKRAVEELDQVVGKERLVQESDFAKLNYVKACAREAFRLHPMAPFNVPHVAITDAVVANYFIPRGSHILLSRIGLGRNPKAWDNPLEFDPERHLRVSDNIVLTEPDLRFISFSTGRRGCMGVTLGTSMTVMLFARLLQGFTWSKPPGMEAIDLTEDMHSLAMAKPLVALAQPRLSAYVYPA